MEPHLNIAVSAARAAGRVIMRQLPQIERLTIKSKSRNDFVSEVDHAAEQEVIRVIHRAHPDHAILAEESGASGRSDFTWIIDPLDGTTNFLHGLPQFAVSIALQHRGRLEHAVIYNPWSQELYTASRGQGAQLDGRRIRVSKARTLEGSLIGTGFPFRENQNLDRYLPMMRYVMEHTAGVRRAGSAALDLAWVAAGRLDGFWESGLSAWDIAAGMLLITEAGGRVADLARDDQDPLKTGNVLAGNPRIFEQLATGLRPLLGVN